MISPSPSEILTVSQLNGIVKHRIESDARLSDCRVTGEISNFKHHSSGHMYFTLKDDASRLRALMFTSRNRHLSFAPRDGMRVVCQGSIGVFDRDGQYQLYVDEMVPDGIGALYAAYVRLRDKLEAEGLFHEGRKRKLPSHPKVVGVVTSPTGAVIRDICSTLARRYPLARVVLAPALVQGPDAAETIVHGIRALSEAARPVDVLIVGRGGGSLEELWPFNEEVVARAVAACPVPVVSAVGHETDFTICDFVADVRAATPTAAAELVAPSAQDLAVQLSHLSARAVTALDARVDRQRQRLLRASSSMALTDPLRWVDRLRQRVDFHEEQLRERVASPLHNAARRVHGLQERLLRYPLQERIARRHAAVDRLELQARERAREQVAKRRTELGEYAAALMALNPHAVLRRGYSMVTRAGQVVTSPSQVHAGDMVDVHLHDGQFSAVVTREGEGADGRGVQSRLNI